MGVGVENKKTEQPVVVSQIKQWERDGERIRDTDLNAVKIVLAVLVESCGWHFALQL